MGLLKGGTAEASNPGAERMSEDTEGFIRLDENGTIGKAIMKDNRPELVSDPQYRQQLALVPLANMKPEQAVACIGARASRYGGTAWERDLCDVFPIP